MPLSQAMLNELQQLIAADVGLQTRLQGADDATQAVEMLVAAAATKGLQIAPSELTAHLAATVEATSAVTLNDAQLESVAGGMNGHGFGALSILTGGVACIINSLVHGPRKGSEEWGSCSNVG